MPRFMVASKVSLIGPPMMKKKLVTPIRLSDSPTSSLPVIVAILNYPLKTIIYKTFVAGAHEVEPKLLHRHIHRSCEGGNP
jgi:hypothetical protein